MKLANFIIKHKIIMVVIFAILLVASTICIFFVNVNYDSSAYLPKDSNLKQGLSIMYNEFSDSGVAQVMIKDKSFDEIISFKNQLNNINGVSETIWLDNMMSEITKKVKPHLNQEISDTSFVKILLIDIGVLDKSELTENEARIYDSVITSTNQILGKDKEKLLQMKSQLNDFYQDKCALFQVMFTSTDYDEATIKAIGDIKALDTENYILGNPMTIYDSKITIEKQTLIALGVAAVIVIGILFLTSSSYFEPILFLVAIGVAVILNMGTNILMPSISYMTLGVAGVLQLGLTIDYSIFLLHRFKQEKEIHGDSKTAMAYALKNSFSPISSSSLTTIVSFIAIMFMSYTIGLDLGIVLAKGVIFSILSVFFLLPALILYSEKLITKTTHKTFEMDFKTHTKFLIKTRKFLPIIIIALIIPCIYFQSANTFNYGNGATFGGKSSNIYHDRQEIESVFGTQNQLAIVLPSEDDKPLLTVALMLNKGVKSAQSQSIIESTGMSDIVPDFLQKQFVSKNGDYHRIVVALNVPEESNETIDCINQIQSVLDKFSDNYYMIGESPSVIEIKNIVEVDYTIITIISILLVALVIAFTFKNALLPILLVATIQGSIWISMSIPYFIGTPLVFLGYLIVSAILLGTTIDYAILLTNNYINARAYKLKFEAIKESTKLSSKTIVTSASIFTLIGFAMTIVSTMPAIKVFGLLIGIGGLMSMLMVLILLPQLLLLFDKAIQKTTIGKKNYINKPLEPPMYVENNIDNNDSESSTDLLDNK